MIAKWSRTLQQRASKGLRSPIAPIVRAEMMLVFLGRRVVGPPVEFAKPTSAACFCRSLFHLEARRNVCTVEVIMRYTPLVRIDWYTCQALQGCRSSPDIEYEILQRRCQDCYTSSSQCTVASWSI